MARYVINAPTLIHLVVAGLRVDPGHRLIAPNSIRSEALELLLREVRAGQRTEAAALHVHEQMNELKMRCSVTGYRAAQRAGRTPARLDTLRDAEYIALTLLQAEALVTADPLLAAAAPGTPWQSPTSMTCSLRDDTTIDVGARRGDIPVHLTASGDGVVADFSQQP